MQRLRVKQGNLTTRWFSSLYALDQRRRLFFSIAEGAILVHIAGRQLPLI